MGKFPEKNKIKVTRAKIVFEGTDECKKDIQELKAYVQDLNECIQEANNSIDRLAENMNRFGPSFKKMGNCFKEANRNTAQTAVSKSFGVITNVDDHPVTECAGKINAVVDDLTCKRYQGAGIEKSNRSNNASVTMQIRELDKSIEKLMFLRTELLAQVMVTIRQQGNRP